MKTNTNNSVRNRILASVLAVMLTISGTAMTQNTYGNDASALNGICISAYAATLYAPSLSGNYIAGYCLSDASVPVYTTSALKTRGSATSKNGKTSNYNAYVTGKSDEIRIYQITGSYCYIGYPISGGAYKYGYVRTSDVTSLSSTAKAITAKAKVTTYRKQNLSSSYGYVTKGDTVYLLSKSGNNYQLIYNTGNNWKIGWTNASGYTAITGSTTNNTNSTATYTGYVNTSSADLILRQTASSTSKQLASMPRGAALTVLDNKKQTSGFYHVSYNGKKGYASASYISFTKPAAQTNLSYGLYKNSSAKITCGFNGYVSTPGKHEGIDISLGIGKPIYSLTDGVITNVVYGSRGSNGLSTIAVYVASQNKTVIYLHSAPLSSLKVGQNVTKGQQLGTQDWRGVSSSSGSHTHVEVRSGKKTLAAKSVNDYTLENANPTSFWNTMGYTVK